MTTSIYHKLPEQIKKLGLVLVEPKSKKPSKFGWQKTPATQKELEAHTGNIGVLCGHANILIIDADSQEIAEKLTATLPETFAVKTSKGTHFYYYTNNCTPARIKDKDGKALIDVQGTGTQCLTVNSVHPSGHVYSVLTDRAIATTSREELDKLLQPFQQAEITKPKNTTPEWSKDLQVIEIKKKIGILQLASEYGIIPNNQGQAKCPFHQDHNPSLKFYPETESFYCFGCQKTGDIFHWVMFSEKTDFPTAKNKLLLKTSLTDTVIDDEVMQVLKKPDFFERIKKEVGKRVVGEENAVHTTILVTAGGRITLNKAPTSTNLCANAISGSGKDIVTSAVIDLFPQETIAFKRTKLSPQSFTYWKRKEIKDGFTWDGKIVYLEDCSSNLINCDTFKTMSSGGSRATIVKDQMAIDILIVGKPVIIITTAEAEPNLESLRRFPLVYLDETTSQTEAIIERVARDAETDNTIEYDTIIMKALTTLQPCHVIIPFAQQIATHFKIDPSLQFRTHFKRILDYVKFSASIHQHQRTKDTRGYIIAEWQDYDNSLPAIKAVTQSKLGFNLTHKQQKLLTMMQEQADWKTASQLLQLGTTYTKKGLYKALDKLTTFGILETTITEDERGHNVQKHKAKTNATITIPNSQELQNPVHSEKHPPQIPIESVPNVLSVLGISDLTHHKCTICNNTPCNYTLNNQPICKQCYNSTLNTPNTNSTHSTHSTLTQ